MSTYEYYEWSNYWIEDESNHEKKRVLLIGDSITRDYREHVSKGLDGVLVDMFVTSRSLDQTEYFWELEHILRKERPSYTCIHFNYGLHGSHMQIEEYRNLYEKAVNYIRQRSEAKLILALSTPVYKDEEGYENDYHQSVIERNQAVLEFAEKEDYPVNDLYTLSYGKEEIRLKDGLHYNEKGSKMQAEQVIKYLNV